MREVRAIRGFTESTTAFERSTAKIVELSKKFGWLPAVENKGEGIFIEINKTLIEKLK